MLHCHNQTAVHIPHAVELPEHGSELVICEVVVGTVRYFFSRFLNYRLIFYGAVLSYLFVSGSGWLI